ncbi:uncharacterized protein LOC116841239 isoform X2 [Odontomachus brunneus]|uniref:uncharacterized protein LOC116841239 isoform X2 n=1 Tax=Odontomachus brunneus TaxID=486640 RepID=UPI0013F1C081|nr:uncharacterized protein LOC116841239 isoform X2 [Odontomachus brunneus]
MIFYYVVLLFLSWPQARCTEDTDMNGEEIFDQLATASENMVHAVRYSNASSKSLEEQLPSVPSSIGATVHYENSNGFVPIIPTNTPSYDESDSSSLQTDNLEEQDDQSEDSNATNAEKPNEFELLKVNNDTPAVANYQDFYENLRSTVNTEIDSQPDETSSGLANGERGKRIESYVHNYRQPQKTKNKDPYNQYHSYSDTQDMKKLTYEAEKVSGNYHQQNAANYNGHGQSAVRHNVAAFPSSSRTNYEVNELTHSNPSGGTYDNVAESSKPRQKFSKPVVVAEPSTYKMEFNNQLHNSDNDYKTSRNLESSSSSETSNHYDPYNDNRQRSYHRTEDSRNLSDESSDYSEYIERPRRVQKNRRRPPYSDSSRKLPKEHRGTLANNAEEQNNHNYNSSRLKSQRHRVKANPWTNDASINLQEESVEDVRHDIRVSDTEIKNTKVQHGSRPKNINTWSQISPSLEISHSNGIELDQMEKPKYVFPLKVNFVPVTNFDHATALGNSQGFDISNALLQNMVTASPIGTYTTSTPLLSTPPSILGQNLAISKNLVNTANLGVSTSVPDIIVGQSSFQNPMHTVVLSQSSGQNKVADTVRTSYLPSTIAPVFTLTSSLTPTLQSIPLQNVQSNVTPRTAFAVTPTPTTVVQHVPINQVHTGVQQLLVPQPTVQTFPSFIQTPVQANTGYQIQVNPHGLQGQNLMNHGNLQMQTLPTPTLLSSQAIPETRINMLPVESQSKKNTYTASGGNLLATASLAVGQNEQKATNINSYYLHNTQQVTKPQEEGYQVVKHIDMTPKTKTYFQANQVVPTILQPNPTLSGIATNIQQYVKLQGNGAEDAVQQLQMQLNRAQLLKNNRPSVTLQTADNVVGHSNSVNAHLPNVGTKNVEIVNPNIKPSPIDTTVNTFDTLHYPATVLTTPIPIFSTIGPITPQTINLQNYVDSLTETGTKAKHFGTVDLKTAQNQERPMYNPINFVPNVDIIKNQHALNNKSPPNEPVRQGLNLVPVMPGGNFFKPSFTAQNELILKPKLASDLQNYAEEMFKESLKTMYNSQKWNNDKRLPGVNQNNSEASDLAKLRLEVQKLTASLSESKYKDQLEAHQSENKVRTTDVPKSSSSKKKPEALLATLEHLLQTRPTGPIHIYHGTSRPSRIPKPSGDSSFDFRDEFYDDSHLREFLTPPRPSHLRTKGVFHEKPIKNKRPGAARFKNGKVTLRKPGRGHSSSRPNGLETSASNINVHLDGTHYHIPAFDIDNMDFESKHQSSYNTYPTFTTSSPDIFNNILRELRTNNKNYDINHPRMHNLLGLLMKNKQLPNRSTQNYRDKDQLRQFFDTDRRQLQQQFYDDALKDYIWNKFEGASQSDIIANRKVYSGNGAA